MSIMQDVPCGCCTIEFIPLLCFVTISWMCCGATQLLAVTPRVIIIVTFHLLVLILIC